MSTMATHLGPLADPLGAVTTWVGRARERQWLLQLEDRLLSDIGISRALLEAGVRAWPWREAREDVTTRLTYLTFKHAVSELKNYTDRELTDLDIARGGIEHAVVYGRPGVEHRRQAADPNVRAKAA